MTLRLNHVSLYVRSLDASARFYLDVLRLPEIENGTKKPHIRWFGLGDGQSLHLIEGNPTPSSAEVSTHFCVSAPDFDAAIAHLRTTGVHFGNLAGEPGAYHLRADGIRSVYLQDLDSYWIELNEDF